MGGTITEVQSSLGGLPCTCNDGEVPTWDAILSKWVCTPMTTGGGSTCTNYYTRSALRSLRDAGGLEPSCHYIVTDFNRGTVGSAQILLHAVDSTTLTATAMIKTSYDNIAWEGRLEIT